MERDNLPGDPDNVNRDDLVFRDGTLSLRNTLTGFDATIDPISCVVRVVITNTSEVVGGTGAYAGATGTFTGTLHGRDIAARNADGSCAPDQPPVLEVDTLDLTGNLSR